MIQTEKHCERFQKTIQKAIHTSSFHVWTSINESKMLWKSKLCNYKGNTAITHSTNTIAKKERKYVIRRKKKLSGVLCA